jgi:hypothetical protein
MMTVAEEMMTVAEEMMTVAEEMMIPPRYYFGPQEIDNLNKHHYF